MADGTIAMPQGFNPMDLVPFLVALVVAFAVARLVNYALKRAAKHVTGKTKTILDDLLLDAIDLPLTIFLTALSVYIAAALIGLSSLPLFGFAAREFFILLGAYSVYRIASAFLHWYVIEVAPAKNLPLADMETTIKRVMALFILSVALIMALDAAGIEVSPLIASLGIAGFAVALAFQDTLGNLFAGIYISVDRPIREGDYVQLEGGQEGYVQKIGWRSTQIRMLANNMVIVPNSKLSSSIITNYYAPDKSMAVVIPVAVSYDSDLRRVERVTVEVARGVQKAVKGADAKFEPFIRYNTFGDSGIGFSVILRVNEYVDKYLMAHEFIMALHERFRDERIEIPYPKRDVYIKGEALGPRARKQK